MCISRQDACSLSEAAFSEISAQYISQTMDTGACGQAILHSVYISRNIPRVVVARVCALPFILQLVANSKSLYMYSQYPQPQLKLVLVASYPGLPTVSAIAKGLN